MFVRKNIKYHVEVFFVKKKKELAVNWSQCNSFLFVLLLKKNLYDIVSLMYISLCEKKMISLFNVYFSCGRHEFQIQLQLELFEKKSLGNFHNN